MALGEELKGVVGIASEEEFDIEEIAVDLRCWESIKRISGHYETDDDTNKREWVEEERWDEERLYWARFQICSQRHVGIGVNKEFPFVFRIPVTERETYHGADRKVRWFISATMPVMKRRHIETQKHEILFAKPSVLTKEVVREVVMIPCAYCGGLMPQTSTFCPNCGARRKG